MVFHCRCFSFPFEEDQEIEYETRTETKSTSTHTYYTAPSDLNRSIPEFHGKTSGFSNLANKSNILRVFTVAELKEATNSFDSDRNIGEGGFGTVYRGVIKSFEHPFDEIQVAVKYAKGVMKGHKEWLTEVNVLGVVEHPNLVKLVGYCAEEGERGMQLFLVYEYMPNGSLRDHLSTRSETPLSWPMRLKVAQDAARGLAYLHEEMDSEIIFRDFKSSNILLDDQWNAKLSDFGVARLGPQEGRTHISTMFQGTVLYAAPEYIESGYLSSKSDVWSYGVFLYELITGRRPLDKNLPRGEQKLLEWVGPYTNSKNLHRIIDPRLQGMCSMKSVQGLVNIANLCLHKHPRSRPKMSEVLELVNALIGVLSPATSPMQPPIPVNNITSKEVITSITMDKKAQDDTKHEGEKVSINIQLTEPASVSPVHESKPLRSWFRKKWFCVS
ncbi:hypothetical protein L2E82_28310 [Cichorium intybus]|uniref:Uncharacterized protein n=1 Tax=Cichorium intybus TaxID=13427 RepID=A0ACB9CVL3_CICIN|nr:hypothetical protein L2E82_28310 [Cichorium intybus]